jgi:hypothetical protein
MSALTGWSVASLLALGALHGVNPAMGWLFAVALGLQERKARAVWRALPPLALGHALAIAVVVAAVALLGIAMPPRALRWGVAAMLFGFGVYRFVRHRHPRYGGMRVGARELTVWSFLMASAHGAALMVLPFVIARPGSGEASPPMMMHGAHAVLQAGILPGQVAGLTATLVHTAAYLLVTGVMAVLFYRKLGLHLLRTAWINLDVVWSAALVVTAVATALV